MNTSETSVLSEKQQTYIDWLAISKYERKPMTEALLAKELNVTDRTLRRWKQTPGFRQLITKRAREFLGDSLPEIYGALAREAIKGSFPHIKLALEMTGEHTDKVKFEDWRSELIDKLKSGEIRPEQVPAILGDDELSRDFFESAGLQFAGVGAHQAQGGG